MKNLIKTFLRFCYRCLEKIIPENRLGDKLFALISFIVHHKRFPTSKPIFNDVLYRIKTSKEILDPLRIFISDKELVKVYVKAVVGEKYNVPTFAILRSIDDIDQYDFPSDCCIKATHGSGQTIIRKNNEVIDIEKVKSWLLMSFYKTCREGNYKLLKPKIIIEPILFGNTNLNDYKFFCMNGSPKLIQVDADRWIGHKRTMFDINWNEQDYSLAEPKCNQAPEKPENYLEMIEIVKKLAAPFSFIRIDLYSDGKQCFLGEITNCHGNASQRFMPLSGEAKASKIIFG